MCFAPIIIFFVLKEALKFLSLKIPKNLCGGEWTHNLPSRKLGVAYTEDMLIFSVLFQFYLMSQRDKIL